MVIQRGRRSAASRAVLLAIDGKRQRVRIEPVASLSKVERSVFDLAVAENSHFVPSDAILLTAYARAMGYFLKAKQDTASWAAAARTAVMLARALRLTPRSTTDPDALGRKRSDRAAALLLQRPWDEDNGEGKLWRDNEEGEDDDTAADHER